MRNTDSNSAFLSWEGTIGRKDYVINMLILIGMLIAISLVNFNVIAPQKFLNTILIFLVNFLQFVLVISVLSVVYRRIADFSTGRSFKFAKIMKIIFAVLFLFPLFYFFLINYLLPPIPIISECLYMLSLFAIIGGIIASIIFCFLKSK